ncbi:MAG: bifunctional DNA-formamidopyrimidine glycosylase/DNA-(apurinic or apyrimidinic site) lyase [Myxococcales bacterium]|nr:bifunctional DNA-formamidopyrimidine glycosylase/DNA-(apurinic or apyrimidinic site) lyase [Myxococcales bacterium]
MPELPEVESVRRGLAEARIRAEVVDTWRSREKMRMECDPRALIGARPGALRRRGKYIVWEMAPAKGQPLGLLLHLGMSGRCGIAAAGDPRALHTHLVVSFGDGRELRLVDPRRFGGYRVAPLAELLAAAPLAELGPEPLDPDFDGELLAARLGRSERGLRDALLDQRAVAGVGNIYAIEALFDAGLHPLTPAARLRASAWDRLAVALRDALQRGIDNGGTTLKDFRNVVGEVGRNQDDLRVYGREGEPCPRCGRALRGFVHGGRSGVYCPFDQSARRVR